MSMEIRSHETILSEVDFHWLSYLYTGFFMLIGLSLFIIGFFYMSLYLFIIGFLTSLPFYYVLMSNKYKRYIVTNERIFIRNGIVFCHEKDIPIAKVNDVQLKQGILQLLFGAGDVIIQVGNDTATTIHDVENAKEFKEAVILAINMYNSTH